MPAPVYTPPDWNKDASQIDNLRVRGLDAYKNLNDAVTDAMANGKMTDSGDLLNIQMLRVPLSILSAALPGVSSSIKKDAQTIAQSM